MNPKKLSVIIFPILLLLIGFWVFNDSKESGLVHIRTNQKHRGVCWVAGPYKPDSIAFLQLLENNVNWISQTPFGWQREHNSPQIGHHIGRNDGWYGESDNGLRETTRLARQFGIKTILKPHIWLRDSQGKWRGEIKMENEEDWQMWFSNYEEFILHYARLAEEEKIEMLCIGTELHRTCVEREADWRNLIARIRQVYSGELTYAANFADEYEEVAFWDVLDYIGVQGYFPVAKNEEPSVEEVKEGWQTHLKHLRQFSDKYEKPILFTEIGYKSTKDAGIEPWQWPERLDRALRENIFSQQTQAHLYQGMFEALADQSFIAGFHFWKWYPPIPEGAERRGRSTDNNVFNIDFTPQNKEAQQVMKEWFGKMSK